MATADRGARLLALLEEHGCATDCNVADEPLKRYVLMESDHGSAGDGGPWWNLGDDPAKLVSASLVREYPSDWLPELLVDLETGKVLDWEIGISVSETGEVV